MKAEKVAINRKDIIDFVSDLYSEFNKELLKIKKHDRLMRDKAHEFNSELQSFKNRTCKSCKNLKGLSPKLGQTYCNLGIEDLNYDMGVRLDFYCNKWGLNETK